MADDESVYSLILADGTVLDNSNCGYNEGILHCWIKEKTLNEVFSLFSDPEKTKVIKHVYRSQVIIYRDFTDLYLIRKLEDYIDVRLTGGTKGEVENDETDFE